MNNERYDAITGTAESQHDDDRGEAPDYESWANDNAEAAAEFECEFLTTKEGRDMFCELLIANMHAYGFDRDAAGGTASVYAKRFAAAFEAAWAAREV